MATTSSSARPTYVTLTGTRFGTSKKNNLHKWTLSTTTKTTTKCSKKDCSHLKLPQLIIHLNPFSPCMHTSPLFCSRFCPMRRPRFSRQQPSLTFMNTPLQLQAAASYPSSASPTKTERVVIKGRVQGVFYRDWTVENALQLGLKGWVRNRRDGSVEALFSGEPDAVKEMEQRCQRGPPAAMVTGLQVFSSNEDPSTGFERKPTV